MIKDIKDIAKKHGCSLIYLFGSQADKGKRYLDGEDIGHETSSDLDIAIAFEIPPGEPLKSYVDLYKSFSEIFDPFEIDLVFMHEVATLLQYEIIKGVRIYEKEGPLADEFEEGIAKRAGDLLFKRKIFDSEIMEAIEDGYFEFEYSPNP